MFNLVIFSIFCTLIYISEKDPGLTSHRSIGSVGVYY